MTSSAEFKCECQHCHGHLQCPLEAAGQTCECPHCGKTTELNAPPPAPASGSNRKILWLAITALILLAFGGTAAFLKLAEHSRRIRLAQAEAARIAAQKAAEAEARANDPLAQAGWNLGPVTIEKMKDSKVIHAVGDLQNETDRRRFGVKVRLELFDAAGSRIGAATDYQASVEPHVRWHFSALVVDARTAAAKVAAVEESP